MALVVVKDGTIQCWAFGHIEVGSDAPVDTATNFRLASVSKTATALAVLQLVEQGRLSVEDPVVTYLPWFRARDRTRSDRIRVRDLLAHTSGIPRDTYGLQLSRGCGAGPEALVRKLAGVDLASDPGTRFEYASFNFRVLQVLVSNVGGMGFQDDMEKQIFAPMGMERTGYSTRIVPLGDLAIGHQLRWGRLRTLHRRFPATMDGGDGLYSNAEDLGRYLRTLLNGGSNGSRRILAPASLDRMFTKGPGPYGLGRFVGTRHGATEIHHDGEAAHFGSDLRLYPDRHLGFALLANRYDQTTYVMADRISEALLTGGENRMGTKQVNH